jgi:D-inositol-3-phosphate glycosyltransferase
MSISPASRTLAVASRIAVIAYHASPLVEPGTGDSGGMTVYVRRLAEALSAKGVSTDIFTRGVKRRVTILAEGVRVIEIPAGPPRDLPKEDLVDHIEVFVNGVRSFSSEQRIAYDVLHSHYWQSGLAASKLAELWGIPFVHSHHTLGKVKNRYLAPGDEPEPDRRLAGEADVIASADVLLTSTDEEWQHLSCLYGAHHDRLKTLHPGVDHERFKPADRLEARRELGLNPEEAVVLYVGRIQPLKGVELAVRAIEQLVPALDRPVRLVAVGGPSGARGTAELDRLKGLAERIGIADHIDFVGGQSHDRLPTYYNASDVVVVCSHSESFGLAALEAHACGIPVVATAVGGLAHIVDDGASGYLVESRDPAVFAARLKDLLGDDQVRAAFSRRAIASSNRFSWATTAAAVLDLYECLIEEQLPEACVC